ncbi:cbb3-type cytochrome c oxidase subunit 3 [Pseudomonas sp. M30-35]|uniref:cbb3-type cytochrome oxidase subunit 3 n=1 Tax=Pseudomonas sp. M30-35 TaxID=1981174 RepID=UPI000B3CAD92|nr:cbb3-type cytochrome c oxidase subunit 3 [Pseudomonas sp. M30-35]ARU88674.1 CcoQ/FixQ family Cbb3-type cytochrome c oxidase assembly chaperone [Pseudomonas sp. M30-35]
MEIGTIRGIGTAVVFVAFIGLLLWAFSSRRKSDFDDAANLPFADEPKPSERDEQSSRSNNQ